MRRASVLLMCFVVLLSCSGQLSADQAKVKNVIVMIADGSGFNTLDAARMWKGTPLLYDGGDWDHYAMATYSYAGSRKAKAQDMERVYDSGKSWSVTPVEGGKRGYTYYFEGYKWHMNNYPDSAATMSQMMTGVRTYNGAINFTPELKPAVSVAELAKQAGKKVGSISTVHMSGATPCAGGGAHNIYRGNHDEIANEMFNAGVLDLIGGAGNPDFDDNGNSVIAKLERDYKYVGGKKTWEQLKRGLHPKGWKLVQEREQIDRMADGEELFEGKVVMVPQIRNSFQQNRSSKTDAKKTAPGDDPLNENVPTLASMAKASLNILGKDPNGFFLQIEGGAVDKAMHANQTGRMIEEYLDFEQAVKVVSDYLDADTNGNNWENTLVIVTADHDHLILGPDADKIPFQPLVDNGAGKLPGNKWYFNSHSNMPVPFFVKGQGQELFRQLPKLIDAYEADGYSFGRGEYFHQIDMGQTLLGIYRQQIESQKNKAEKVAG